jgi:hypothetical protein
MSWQEKVEEGVRKSFYKFFGPRTIFAGIYSEEQIEKFISFTVKALNFSLNIALVLSVAFLIYKWLYPRYGFERTLLALMMTLIILMRGFLMRLKNLAEKS